MTALASRRSQQGATLVVGLIMLVLITLVVTSAFTLSSGNLKAVSNMQFRNEAIAAANKAIEQVIGSSFTKAPAGEEIIVDIDNDPATPNYVVDIAAPTCIRASVALAAVQSSLKLPAMSNQSHWNTVWDIDATVTDEVSGASSRIRQGVRVLLTQSQKKAVCP
jgi:Tfp pilus assembly protein PilX